MSQLLLKGVKTPSTVQEVDSVTVAEQVSVDRPLQVSATSRLLNDLIFSLLVMRPPFLDGTGSHLARLPAPGHRIDSRPRASAGPQSSRICLVGGPFGRNEA